MAETRLEILGAYILDFTDEQIKQFIEDSYGNILNETEKQEMLAAKREELASVAAFDIRVMNADRKFDAGDFTQPGSDQVAYDEVYLSPDGYSIESNSKPKDPTNFRIYFFLHFVNSQKPLRTSYGELEIPELQPIPDYLNKIHPFKPVD